VIGVTVSHYHILKKIGQGGMGVVYQARDLKLGRLVALKFLPESVRSNSRALHQLMREARAASALNHPNICTIYEIDEYQGQSFIAMEFLEGETLRSKIQAGPLSAAEATAIVRQVLEGLEAVHGSGIVHRDLKPENVYITRLGPIKLLDFGLAKAVQTTDGKASLPDNAPVLADTIADERNMLAGTIPYMSPEQIRDEELTPQADLFSVGALMFEMLTGKRAFSGNSVGSLLEAVLVQTPPSLTAVNPAVPRGLETIVEKLLQKDRTRRYPSAAAVKVDLEALTYSPKKVTRSSRLAVAAVIALPIGAIVYAWSTFRGKANLAPLPKMVMTQVTSEPGLELFPNISPDGRSITYSSAVTGNWDIFTLRIGGAKPVNLTADSPSDDTEPALSPSGDLIAFRSERDGGGIYVMGATGESARRVTSFGFNPAWSPDGRQLVVAGERVIDSPNERTSFSKLFIVDVATGKSRTLDIEDGVQPRWSPHQYRIAYWAHKGGQRDLWTIRPDGTDPQPVTNDAAVDWNPVWDASGTFLYFSSDRSGSMNLWRIPIDEKSGKPLDAPQAVTSGAGQRQHPSISSDGKFIAYVEETVSENIRRRSFDSKSRKLIGAMDVVTKGTRIAKNPNPSPDGQWVAYQSWGKQEDIYIVRADGTGERYLTNDDFKDRVPRWSPDGNRLAFYSNRSGNFEIWTINKDGSGLKQITDDRTDMNIRSVWSNDGRFLAGFHTDKGSFILELDRLANVIDRAVLPPFEDGTAYFQVWSWSPDGKWLAGNRVTRSGEYKGVAVYSIESKKFELLTDYGYSPSWLANSQDMMFMNADRAYLINARTRKVEDLGSVSGVPQLAAANGISQLASDNTFVYFTVVERESDVWLIDLHEK
jgi:serine/threonine protein kinase/dipeptidyl aminopeptidase/acylaminoacyl peptidase